MYTIFYMSRIFYNAIQNISDNVIDRIAMRVHQEWSE